MDATTARQCDGREIRRTGHADLRVGGDDLLLGGLDVRPSLQERGGQAGGNVRRMRLVDQLAPTGDRRRKAPEQNADEVLLLRDPALEDHDGRAGAEHELLGLAHVDQRRDTAAFTHLRQLQRLLT